MLLLHFATKAIVAIVVACLSASVGIALNELFERPTNSLLRPILSLIRKFISLFREIGNFP